MSKDAIERYANLLVKNHGWTEAHRIAAEEVRGKQGNLDGFWTRVLYEIERWGRCMSKEDRMVHRYTKVGLTVIALALVGLVASQAIPGAKAFSDCGKWEHAPCYIAIAIPSGTKPLSGKGHWLTVQLLADFAPSATLRLLNDINPWDEGCPGYHL